MSPSQEIQVTSVQELSKQLDTLPSNTILAVDVDNTIITPVSEFFRTMPYCNLIDDIKRDKQRYPDYECLVSRWRLQRKVMLVDPAWPELIHALKAKYAVYGFTQMDTGQFGDIESMEDWRYQELKGLGIEFSQNPSLESVKLPHEFQNPPVFYKGIFLTGSVSKGEMIRLYQETFAKALVVLIDDRKGHLLDMESVCQSLQIPFMGILFQASWLTPVFEPHSPVAELQKNWLLQYKKWVEDEEARDLVEQNA